MPRSVEVIDEGLTSSEYAEEEQEQEEGEEEEPAEGDVEIDDDADTVAPATVRPSKKAKASPPAPAAPAQAKRITGKTTPAGSSAPGPSPAMPASSNPFSKSGKAAAIAKPVPTATKAAPPAKADQSVSNTGPPVPAKTGPAAKTGKAPPVPAKTGPPVSKTGSPAAKTGKAPTPPPPCAKSSTSDLIQYLTAKTDDDADDGHDAAPPATPPAAPPAVQAGKPDDSDDASCHDGCTEKVEVRDRSKANKFAEMLKKGTLPQHLLDAWIKAGTSRAAQTKVINGAFIRGEDPQKPRELKVAAPSISKVKETSQEKTTSAGRQEVIRDLFVSMYCQGDKNRYQELVRKGAVVEVNKHGHVWSGWFVLNEEDKRAKKESTSLQDGQRELTDMEHSQLDEQLKTISFGAAAQPALANAAASTCGFDSDASSDLDIPGFRLLNDGQRSSDSKFQLSSANSREAQIANSREAQMIANSRSSDGKFQRFQIREEECISKLEG